MDDRLGQRSYEQHRDTLLLRELEKARVGQIHPHWRDRLEDTPLIHIANTHRGPPAHMDMLQLAVHELREMPVQPWEPYAAGGNWRVALDSWFRDIIAVETRIWTPPTHHPLASWHTTANNPALLAAEQPRREALRRRLDCLGAEYRAGLFGGGEPVDWVAWLGERAGEWEDSDGIAGRPEVPPSEAYQLYITRLPDYWRV